MTDQKILTEEMPENTQDLDNRGLILASSGEIRTEQGGQRLLTEDLPQEEDEDTGAQVLES